MSVNPTADLHVIPAIESPRHDRNCYSMRRPFSPALTAGENGFGMKPYFFAELSDSLTATVQMIKPNAILFNTSAKL